MILALALALFLRPAPAGAVPELNLFCRFSNAVLTTEDIYTFADGRADGATFAVGVGGAIPRPSCRALHLRYAHRGESALRLSGRLRCVDGAERDFERELDLFTLELKGGSLGVQTCLWQ